MIVGEERPAGSWAASAKARRSGVRKTCAAFTLLEILISLALIALLIGATISVSPRGDSALTTDEVFWKALTEARKQALTTQQDIRLGFDARAKAFVIGVNIGTQTDTKASLRKSVDAGTQSSAAIQTFPVRFADTLTVDFLPAAKSNGSMLLGGELVETGTMPYVTLYSDGTCTPFRVQFHSSGAARIIAIDPWTCAEVLEEKKP